MKKIVIQLENELIKHNVKRGDIKTLFIGGGTPSSVEAKFYEKLFTLITPYLADNCEITTEANPNSATKIWMSDMKNFGINRISFGVQSFDDKKLKYLGRAHNSNSAIKAIQDASCINLKHINCDIIYGVNGDDMYKLKKDFDIIQQLPIDHLSAYSLTLEEGTKFEDKPYVKIDDEELSMEIFDYISSIGFNQYEISNFSKNSDCRSRHNLGYWQYKEYLGIGSGAVGKIGNKRFYTQKDVNKYITNPNDLDIEILSDDDIKIEKILLGLRSVVGVDLEIFSDSEKSKIDTLIEQKQVRKIGNKIFNNDYLLSDEISLYICE